MSAVKEKIKKAGLTMGSIARGARVDTHNVFHYIARRYFKISKSDRKKIRRHLISIGILPPPRLANKCTCPTCGKEHAQSKHIHRAGQSELREKIVTPST